MHGDKVAAEVLVHTAYLEGYYQGYLNSLAKKGEKKRVQILIRTSKLRTPSNQDTLCASEGVRKREVLLYNS